MTILKLTISSLAPLLIGYIAVRLLWPDFRRSWQQAIIRLCLAIGIGFGASSCLLFVWLAVGGTGLPFRFFLVSEAVFTLSAAFISWPALKKVPLIKNNRSEGTVETPLEQILPSILLVMIALSAGSFLILAKRHPHGTYDAWMIWNMHARFLFGGEYWRGLFSHTLSWIHADYPLLLPCIVARSWYYIGNAATLAPIAIAFCFTLATVGFIVSAISMLRGKVQGFLAGIAILGTHYFIICGASQYADIPLSFFMCACLAMFFFCEMTSEESNRYLFLAGIMAGMAAWTKNEGSAFLIAVLISRFIFVTFPKGMNASLRELGLFISGALPALLVLAYFKLMVAPVTDIFDLQGIGSIALKLTDPERYIAATNLFSHRFLRFGGIFAVGIMPVLAIYVIMAGIKIEKRYITAMMTSVFTVLFMAGTYLLIYVITPWDIEWHITHSLNRLFMQLWPSALFCLFMIVRPPGQSD